MAVLFNRIHENLTFCRKGAREKTEERSASETRRDSREERRRDEEEEKKRTKREAEQKDGLEGTGAGEDGRKERQRAAAERGMQERRRLVAKQREDQRLVGVVFSRW